MDKAARPQTGCHCRPDIRGQVVRSPVLPDLPVPPTATLAAADELEHHRVAASIGNTGGARVRAFAAMPIAADLRAIIDSVTDR